MCTLYTDTLASRAGKPITPGGDSLIHVKPPQELIRNKFHPMTTCLHQLGRKLEKVTPYCGDGQFLKCLTGRINPAEFHWEHTWTKGGYCANVWLPLSVCTCTLTQRRSRLRVYQRGKRNRTWWMRMMKAGCEGVLHLCSRHHHTSPPSPLDSAGLLLGKTWNYHAAWLRASKSHRSFLQPNRH